MSIRVPILTYHSIDETGSIISTSPDHFRSQMQHLKNKQFNVISLKDIVTSLRNKLPLPQKSISITFDDGFKNFYSVAYPILKKYGFPATIFLVPGYCGKNNLWDGQPERIPILDLLDWNEIQDMAINGMDFGTHTMHHPDLSKLSVEQAYIEITESKSLIQKYLRKDISFFAYPYGNQSKNIQKIVKEQFLGACSTELDFLTLNSNVHSIPRIDMYYFSKNNFFKWLGTPLFSFYIQIRKTVRSLKIK